MTIKLSYDITLGTQIEQGRLRFKVIATSKETLQDSDPVSHEGIGDNFNDALAEVENRLLLEYQQGQRPQKR